MSVATTKGSRYLICCRKGAGSAVTAARRALIAGEPKTTVGSAGACKAHPSIPSCPASPLVCSTSSSSRSGSSQPLAAMK